MGLPRKTISPLVVITVSTGLTLAAVSGGHSSDLDNKYFAYKDISCSKYTERRPFSSGFYKSWVAGWITAYNDVVEDNFSLSGGAGVPEVMAWLDDYCRQHPDKSLSYAIDEYSAGHSKTRFRSRADYEALQNTKK